jgi:hypothetical protein
MNAPTLRVPINNDPTLPVRKKKKKKKAQQAKFTE